MRKTLLEIFAGIILCLMFLAGCSSDTSNSQQHPKAETYYQIYVGEDSISEYEIFYKGVKAKKAATLLESYIENISGQALSVKSTSKADDFTGKEIVFVLDENAEEHNTRITDGTVIISGKDEEELVEASHSFANAYLGYMWAGTDEETINLGNTTLRIPKNTNRNYVWMAEREPIITLWNVNSARGAYLNNNTSLKVDVMSYSEEQLYDYVRMMKHCGFTGIQVTDMCSAWAGSNPEFVQERIRVMADAAHSMDMDFTLWVWGSEFTGYGWVDNTVTYEAGEYSCARENPAVQATFDKYYSIYAELADCTDRLIAHFYDPGNLGDANDVAYFSSVLRDKFKAINPEIDFGVSCWMDTFDKNILVSVLGNDVTLYEGMKHDDTSLYGPFRSIVANLDCRLGTWEWNGCEMEIDQLAQMNFQPTILQETYQTIRNYDGIKTSSYWSTMDSYHVVNVFSLYCAAALEQDPDLDVTELTYEVARISVGEEYADDFAGILSLIEEARSGYTWNNFFWSEDENLIKGDNYPYEDIIEKCEKYIPILDEMIEQRIESDGLPLPMPLYEVLGLVRPHLQQIYDFALFRRDFDALKSAYSSNEINIEELQEGLQKISTPISEYNTVVGLWGQIEARVQRELIVEYCDSLELEYPQVPDFDINRKFRIYEYFAMYQKGYDQPVVQYPPYFQYGAAYGDETYRLVEELIEDGVFTKNEEDDGVYLTDWDNHRFAFN